MLCFIFPADFFFAIVECDSNNNLNKVLVLNHAALRWGVWVGVCVCLCVQLPTRMSAGKIGEIFYGHESEKE